MAQGKALTPEEKKAIVALKEYFDRTIDDLEEQGELSVQRVSNALGFGLSTVRRTMADYSRGINFDKESIVYRGRPQLALSDSAQTIVREYIRNANKEGAYITLETLCQYLEEVAPEQEFSIRTLGRALDRWGFTFGKGIRTQRFKEKDHVVVARQRYLRRKRANRKGKGTIRPEVYIDESYVNKNHSTDFVWYYDDDGPWIQKPTGKGERLIIMNAITKDGWVPGAKVTFKSTRKTGDYHGQMNQTMFTKWFEEKLLPNIPARSLIIMDNAAYHNVLSPVSAPTPACKKEKIRSWLEKNNFPLKEDCLKAELVDILTRVGPQPIYVLDEIANKNGHEVLRTPPYHPELQPIETCWGIVKNEIACNCDFTMNNLIQQLEGAFGKVTAKTCSGLIRKARDVEDAFWRDDAALDEQS
ncbi:transposase [uncultured Desulfobacter sp.]|uniref:transposase n=1 Tax=uncultured Desulfobacter sp. TaxID=240139 RepID=UPI0029F4A164|nr:transposase [uncultured Desulfobacter sp.]